MKFILYTVLGNRTYRHLLVLGKVHVSAHKEKNCVTYIISCILSRIQNLFSFFQSPRNGGIFKCRSGLVQLHFFLYVH